MHKNAQKCVWEKTPPLSGKNPTPPYRDELVDDGALRAHASPRKRNIPVISSNQ